MKSCLKCNASINEDNDKYCMIITKLGRKILEFGCFHFECWKEYFKYCVKYGKG